jgi:hypothetical protein
MSIIDGLRLDNKEALVIGGPKGTGSIIIN